MSGTKASAVKSNRGTAIKILNDVDISMPLAEKKSVSISMSKTKISPSKQKQMDHYVLQTIKGESTIDGEVDETIDFILRDEEFLTDDEMITPAGEITEELRLSAGEGDEGEGDYSEGTATKTEEIVEHVCGKCYKSFRRFNGLKKHLDFCRFDSGYHLRKAEMLKNLDKIEKDAVIMENKDVCFCCGESYDTFHLGHINCPDCPKSFKSQTSYERHIFITHCENNDHPCSICNAKLRSAALLKLHEEQHQNRGKPFACKICGKDFTRSYHLKRHQKYSSCSANEQDSMNCKVCNKVFYRLDNLRAHLKQHLGTHVTKKTEYMCPTCKNCFYSLSTLNIHTRTHTGERPFDCDLCEKNFPSLVALKKHRRYHTGEKPYTCSVCSASFAVKEVLNRHMKRHTGERPHVCSECGKSFIQATQLRNHAKTHIRPFKCSICDGKYKTQKQLERHEIEHTKRKRIKFRCERCKVIFSNDEELQKHCKLNTCEKAQPKKKIKERTDCAVCEKNFDNPKSLHFHILKVHEVDPEEFENPEPKVTSKRTNSKAAKGGTKPKRRKTASPTTTDTEESEASEVVQELILEEVAPSNTDYKIIPLDSDSIMETVSTAKNTPEGKQKMRSMKNGLAERLAAAIADNESVETASVEKLAAESEEDMKLKENVRKLLDMLVDGSTLKKFGWPETSEEEVLCRVIENCGHDLVKDSESYKDLDYATRMREYVKLLFTVVIHNDSIRDLLNNYPIDEVIEYVLGNDEDEDGDESADESTITKKP